MAKYGIPYMGSKDKIAEVICKFIPKDENFYDLFGGGCAITHCMSLFKNKFKHLHYNELEKTTVDFIKDIISGKYNKDTFKPEFIDRETFLKNKDKCAYTRIIWSFGNNQKNYLFGEDIEQEKKSLHNAVVFEKFDETAIKILGYNAFKSGLSIYQKRLLIKQSLKKYQLQHLEQLERLQHLEQLERIKINLLNKSYNEVEIKPNSIIYCDPPYIETATYLSKFNHDKFYEWALSNKYPVFISEYKMPKEFDIALSITKCTILSPKGKTKTHAEKLFVNEPAKKLLYQLGRKTFPNTQ
jgi:site-specific DNA-adenine methylase